jgi:hypothetical protein
MPTHRCVADAAPGTDRGLVTTTAHSGGNAS